MRPREYRRLRLSIGSQKEVAARLKIHPKTISKRERGLAPIDTEAEFAMKHLATLRRSSEGHT